MNTIYEDVWEDGDADLFYDQLVKAADYIIDKKIYKEKFEGIPETTFYKAVSRLAKDGEIERITKGIYCKPKKGRFGTTVSNEKDILEYFFCLWFSKYRKPKQTTKNL